MNDSIDLLLKLGAGGTGAFVVRWLWERYWKKRDDFEGNAMVQVQSHGERIVAVEKRLETGEVREGERQKLLGRMEGEINRLDGKIEGLQSFWRSKFEKLEEKLEERLDRFRVELKADQSAHEQRQSSTLDAHQKRVHDRLNEATAAQAQMINELVDKLVDRVGETEKMK